MSIKKIKKNNMRKIEPMETNHAQNHQNWIETKTKKNNEKKLNKSYLLLLPSLK